MSRFWVEKVTELQPYVPGEQSATGSVVKLNTNEHALSPSGSVMAAVSAVQGEQLRRYPDLTQAVSEMPLPLWKGLRLPVYSREMGLTRCWLICGLLFYQVKRSAPSIRPTVFILYGPTFMARD